MSPDEKKRSRVRLVVSEKTISRVALLPKIALWVFGGGALAGVLFVGSFYFAMRVEMSSTEVRVPDLAGMTMEDASAKVETLGLVLQVAEQRNDPAVPSGRILEQSPIAGGSVRRGRKVKLIVSLGDKVLEVPNLVGQASRAVAIELRQLGFTPGYEVRIPAPAAPVGTVLAQVPPSGTPAVPNTRVHRLVSDGPERTLWVMPDLGRLTRNEAEAWARRNGFRVTARSVTIGRRPSGSVLGQLPLAGHPIRTNDIVELTVAR